MNNKIMRMLCAALLTAGLLLASGCGVGSNTMTIHAYLRDSAGLFVGNDVGVLGVTVGKITSITPVGEQVEVTMQVDSDQPIPADAWADVVSRSVATDRYVELTPVYKPGDPKMRDGAQILVDHTQTPVDFDEVLSALNTFATGIGGSKTTTAAIRHFLNAGAKTLGGRGPLLNQTIHSLANGINGLAAQRGNVAATLTSVDHLVGTIAANQGTAKTFIRQVSAASTLLANERVNFRAALRSLTKAVKTVASFAVDNRAQLVKLLGGSSTLMKTVLARQKQLAEILRVMPLAMQNLALIRGDRIPVRIDPLILDPLGGVLQNICGQLPGNLCSILDGSQLGG